MHRDVQTQLLNRLRQHLANKTTDLAPHNLKVPASHYVSDEQTEQEIDAMFMRRPLLVALSPQFPAVGDYVTHTAVKTNLLLVRDKQGEARAYINACRHRGARLAEGCGNKATLVCPFHAWTWGLDGKILSRPNSAGGFDAIDATFDHLHEVPCYEISGLVFVLLEGDDIKSKVHALIGDALPDLANYRIDEMQYIDSRMIELDCNYKFLIDGFTETYHIPTLHTKSISPYYYAASTLVDSLGDVVRLMSPRRTIDKEFAKPESEQNEVLAYTTTEYLLAPNVLITHQVDHIQFWTAYPVDGANRCRIQLNVFWPQPMDEEAWRKARLNVDLVWDVVTGEDLPQSVAIHNNLASGDLPELIFGRNEPALIYYHQNIAKAIGSDRPVAVPDHELHSAKISNLK